MIHLDVTSNMQRGAGSTAEDGLRLRVLSWNVAAVNNNPFEYSAKIARACQVSIMF